MAEPLSGIEAGAPREPHDHFAFHWLVVEDIDVYNAAVSDKAGLPLETDDPRVIFRGVHAAQCVLEGVHAFSCALYGSHARGSCTEDAGTASA